MKIKIFSASKLKYIAAFLMVLDHLNYFLGDVGPFPLWMRWLGRLSAPLFMFLLAESYFHTHDRKKLLKRLYAAGAGMGVAKTLFAAALSVDFLPVNIFATYFLALWMMWGIDRCRNPADTKDSVKGIVFIISPFAVASLAAILPQAFWQSFWGQLVQAFLPLLQYAEGATLVIPICLILYFFRDDEFMRDAAYLAFNGLLLLSALPYGISELFTENFFWMAAGTVIFFRMYNGEKGHSSKWFFYIFYPLHIFILYFLQLILK